jgi:hypothetical protein
LKKISDAIGVVTGAIPVMIWLSFLSHQMPAELSGQLAQSIGRASMLAQISSA